MSKILATKCDDANLAMAMDDMSYPHCVWINGNTVKYARFCGDEWRIVGGTAVVLSSLNTVRVSKNCIGFDINGNPFFAIMDGSDMVLVSYNGATWFIETVWANAINQEPLTWSTTWAGFPVVTIITRSNSNKKIWTTDRSAGTWGSPNDEVIPVQSNNDIELKTVRVNTWVYAFWNGIDNSLGTTWIGHAAWDVISQSWVYRPDKKVSMSIIDGTIGGLDFVVWDELLSSSSESSSS